MANVSHARLVEVIGQVWPCSCDEMWVDDDPDGEGRPHDPACDFSERVADAILKAEVE